MTSDQTKIAGLRLIADSLADSALPAFNETAPRLRKGHLVLTAAVAVLAISIVFLFFKNYFLGGQLSQVCDVLERRGQELEKKMSDRIADLQRGFLSFQSDVSSSMNERFLPVQSRDEDIVSLQARVEDIVRRLQGVEHELQSKAFQQSLVRQVASIKDQMDEMTEKLAELQALPTRVAALAKSIENLREQDVEGGPDDPGRAPDSPTPSSGGEVLGTIAQAWKLYEQKAWEQLAVLTQRLADKLYAPALGENKSLSARGEKLPQRYVAMKTSDPAFLEITRRSTLNDAALAYWLCGESFRNLASREGDRKAKREFYSQALSAFEKAETLTYGAVWGPVDSRFPEGQGQFWSPSEKARVEGIPRIPKEIRKERS